MPLNELADAAHLHFINSSSLCFLDLMQNLYRDSQVLITTFFAENSYGAAARIRAARLSGIMPKKRIAAASTVTVNRCSKSDDG
jgi:hypothetical protein